MTEIPASTPEDLPRRRLVVVGAGMAAVRLVEELVAHGATTSEDPDGWEVTVLGDEAHRPYNRILLSAVLEGTHRPEALELRPRTWYDEHGITLRTDARVLAIDPARRDVMLVDGSLVHYDRLVLATGAIPTLPPIRGLVRMDGSLHPAVHAFRSLAECEDLMTALAAQSADEQRPRRAVVVGGGLLGLQVARALGARGLDTEIVEGGDHLLHAQLDTAAGRILARGLRKLGVEVYTGVRAVRLNDASDGPGLTTARTTALTAADATAVMERSELLADAEASDHLAGTVKVVDPLPHHPGRVALRLDNGFTLDTDLVILTAGGRPAAGLARNAGLEVRRGIVVDDRLTTSDPHIHAIGDCAQHDGAVTGFVPPAWEQAGLLAGLLTGADATYDGHRNVARLRATDLDVAVLGDAAAEIETGGEVVEVANPIAGTHRRLVVREGRIVAATLVGDLSRIGLITQHFDRGTVLGPTEPGALLLPDRPIAAAAAGGLSATLPDDAEICACAGVSAGRIRACASLEEVRDTTRATTGCGGCASTVRDLLAARSPSPTPV